MASLDDCLLPSCSTPTAALQEDLTDEMAGLAASLKRNVIAINSAVKDREGLLRDTEELMEHNQQAASWNVKVSKHVKRRWIAETCQLAACSSCLCIKQSPISRHAKHR